MIFIKRSLLLVGFCLCSFAGILSAEMVLDVEADGTLKLAQGKRVTLAGIQMDSDGVSVLRVLVKKQDVRLQRIAHREPVEKESAYVYLDAKSLKLPVKPTQIASSAEVLINEMLVRLGAAKVLEVPDFSRKAKFLKVQEEAKKKGEGVWSYEVS